LPARDGLIVGRRALLGNFKDMRLSNFLSADELYDMNIEYILD